MKCFCLLISLLCFYSPNSYAHFDVVRHYFDEFEILDHLYTKTYDEVACEFQKGELVCQTCDDTPYTGRIYKLYSDGNILSDVHLNKGKPDGLWHIFYPDGKFMTEISFRNGIIDGPIHGIYPDGGLRTIGHFTAGKPDYFLNIDYNYRKIIVDSFIKYQDIEAIFFGSLAPKNINFDIQLTEGTAVSVMKMIYKNRNFLGEIELKDGYISGSGAISVIDGKLNAELQVKDPPKDEFLIMAYKNGQFIHDTNTTDKKILSLIDTLSKFLK